MFGKLDKYIAGLFLYIVAMAPTFIALTLTGAPDGVAPLVATGNFFLSIACYNMIKKLEPEGGVR